MDFTAAHRLHDRRLIATNFLLFLVVQSIAIMYTTYITVFIAGRLWWVGRARNKMLSFEDARRNRYSRAISALVQSGTMQVTMRISTITAEATGNLTVIPLVGRISASFYGISATLLVWQLSIFQKQTQDHDAPPLTTGATMQFVRQARSSSSSGGELHLAPVPRRRRASTSAAVHPHYSTKDTQTSGYLRVAFTPHNVDGLPLSDNSTSTILPTKKNGREGAATSTGPQ
ncbi:hypothetical protein FRB94_008953 [Tulasnella sp. JGI-2019a]|nr:hypothetical protein FRB93_008567 [Tulasnella sp. JGI-2019a]KAG8995534.1 hypothetical protein FRB94_008953 [Tulasnella sp. JGI-2019a]